MKKHIILALLICSTALGQMSEVDKQELTNVNILENPGFENGLTRWSNAGSGVFALEISGANLALGARSASWDAAAASDTLTSRQITIPSGLQGRACFASFLYKGGDTNIDVEVIDGAIAVQATSTLAVQTAWTLEQLSFTCPTSGTLAIRLISTADAAIIYVDQFFVGVKDTVGALTDPMTTRGDLIHRNTSNATDRLAVGAADTVLKSDGTDPSYGKVVNADVDASAAISGTKIDADFGNQDLTVDTNVLYVDATNNRVGVNVAPLVPLHIEDASPEIRIRDTDGGATVRAAILADSVGSLLLDSDAANASTGGIQLRPGGAVKMFLDQNGEVGIGTTSPGSLLDVTGALAEIRLSDSDGTNNYSTIRSDLNGSLFVIADENGGSGVMFLQAGGATRIQAETNGATSLFIRTTGANDICATASGTGAIKEIASCTSSIRFKENVRDIGEEEIAKVYQLRGVNFDWKEGFAGTTSEPADYGLIAEEVDEIFPELVPKDENGIPNSVNYRHFTGLLLEALKAQKIQIEELKQRLDDAGL